MWHLDDLEERVNFEKFFGSMEHDEEILGKSKLDEPMLNEDVLSKNDEDDRAKAYEDMCRYWCKVSKLNHVLIKNVKPLEKENFELKCTA